MLYYNPLFRIYYIMKMERYNYEKKCNNIFNEYKKTLLNYDIKLPN
jgi:hypothetical protein